MTPEEQAAADAAAKQGAGSSDGGNAKDAAYWERVAKEAIEGREKAKEKLKSLEPLATEGQKALDAKKTAEEKVAELLRERDTYKAQAEESSAAMSARLALEVAAIPEAMRGLVPGGLSPAKQLEWIGQAQAAGLFGVKSASPGAELHGGSGGATITQTELANLPIGARRTALMQSIRDGKVAVVAG